MPQKSSQPLSQPKLSLFFTKKTNPEDTGSVSAKHLPPKTDHVECFQQENPEKEAEKRLAVRSSTPPRKRARGDKTEVAQTSQVPDLDCPESEESDAVPAKRRNARRKGKKANLRESSSDSELPSEDDVTHPVGARKVSVIKAISAVSTDLEMVIDDNDTSSTPPSNTTQKSKTTPPTKSKGKASVNSEERSITTKDRAELRPKSSNDAEASRHNDFVRKVGLLRKNGEQKDDSEGAEAHSRGERIEPCALTVPKGAKLTPFEEQVVAIKRSNPATVRASIMESSIISLCCLDWAGAFCGVRI
jgi:hypothetical protein